VKARTPKAESRSRLGVSHSIRAMAADAGTSQRVLDRCRELGFALTGIADAAPTQYERELLEWLAAGKHGEMEYLRRNVRLRIDPRAMVPGAKSIICVADRYVSNDLESAGGCPRFTPTGKIARYARGDDYHVVMRKRLATLCKELQQQFPNEIFRACVDTAPVLEREHAQRAGLGAVGKNTLLIERGVGSYLLLGEIIATLPLAASRAAEHDPCGTCTRCIDACPTHAITPWSVDATKCISYLTIEHRGEIDEQFHEAMGEWVFGCDVCQEVCPHNQPTAGRRKQQGEALGPYLPTRQHFDLLEILNWDEEARRRAFVKSSMKRAKLDMMKRNALIAAGNFLEHQQSPAILSRITHIADDPAETDVVRATARTVLRRLNARACQRTRRVL
jgi:epoxyqueuosine reductase